MPITRSGSGPQDTLCCRVGDGLMDDGSLKTGNGNAALKQQPACLRWLERATWAARRQLLASVAGAFSEVSSASRIGKGCNQGASASFLHMLVSPAPFLSLWLFIPIQKSPTALHKTLGSPVPFSPALLKRKRHRKRKGPEALRHLPLFLARFAALRLGSRPHHLHHLHHSTTRHGESRRSQWPG
jgi:hypothetical protein